LQWHSVSKKVSYNTYNTWPGKAIVGRISLDKNWPVKKLVTVVVVSVVVVLAVKVTAKWNRAPGL